MIKLKDVDPARAAFWIFAISVDVLLVYTVAQYLINAFSN